MARELKALPTEMYVAEVTINGMSWHGPFIEVTMRGPYETLAVARGQATAQNYWSYDDTRTVTTKFFKGTMVWEEMK